MQSMSDFFCDSSHHFPQENSAASCQSAGETQKLDEHVSER